VWSRGGEFNCHSKEEEIKWVEIIFRFIVKASHRINEKSTTLVIDMRDPRLDRRFHCLKKSG